MGDLYAHGGRATSLRSSSFQQLLCGTSDCDEVLLVLAANVRAKNG